MLQGLKQLGIEPKASAVPGGGGGRGEQQQGEGGGAGVVGGKRQQLDMLVDPGLFRQVRRLSAVEMVVVLCRTD